MNLIKQLKGALGYLFIRCSGIGRLDDPYGRVSNATLLVATWIWVALLSILGVFTFWIYDLRRIYWDLWPYRSANPKMGGLGLALIVGVPSIVIAWRIRREYMSYVKPRATLVETLIVGICYMLVIMSVLLNLSRFGSVLGLVIHLFFLMWLMREYRLQERGRGGVK